MSHSGPLVFGEVLFDCFPDGTEVLGGAPFNVAWHLQGFGLNPLLVSRVGNDTRGQQIRSAMIDWGMLLSGLQQDDQHATGEVAVTVHDGEPTFKIVDDRAYDHIARDQLPAANPELIYHGTLALRNQVSAESLATIRNGSDAPVFIDVNLRPPWWQRETLTQFLKGSAWVKLNKLELEELASNTLSDTRQMARDYLREHGLRLLVVTLGEEGALAVDASGNDYGVSPGNIDKVVDTVGAGDAFSSVVIMGLVASWPLDQILQRAQQFASMVVGVRGAVIRDRNVYLDMLEQWEREDK